MDSRLTHLDDEGSARMVDVGEKAVTKRVAIAQASLRMSPQAAAAIAAGDAPKGDVLGTARLAGIQAAKRTAELIPLAHPISLTYIDVKATLDPAAGRIELTSEVHASDVTGVEMEAMSACAVAALTVYDMAKGIEKGIEIEHVRLLEKRGGRSDWRRDDAGGAPGERDDVRSGVSGGAPGERDDVRSGVSGGAPGERDDVRSGVSGGASPPAFRVALLTISSSRAGGRGGEDRSGPALERLVTSLRAQVCHKEILPDDRRLIEERLKRLCDVDRCALVLTSGGTGLSPSDVTPEATGAVIDRQAPGIAEAIRDASRPYTRHWLLSRGIAGIRGSTLIVNLPGSPAGVEQAGAAITDALPHALALLAGGSPSHRQRSAFTT